MYTSQAVWEDSSSQEDTYSNSLKGICHVPEGKSNVVPPTAYSLTPSNSSSSDISNSSCGSGVQFYFTEQATTPGWNNVTGDKVQETDDEDDSFTDHLAGRSYEEFERKLKHGFMEAPNLGLISAPPAIFDYQPALQRIDLKDNKIELLPDQFFDELPMLCWCDLRYNRLQTLPPMNAKHDNLNVLLAQNNQLSDLPCSLAYAVKLHTLGWTNNCITEPPRRILLRGCQAILGYLRIKLAQRLPVDEYGNPVILGGDEQLKDDLRKTALKSVARRVTSQNSIVSGGSDKSANSTTHLLNHKRRIDRLKYTWGLWKSVPYSGVNNQELFETSIQEVKDEMRTKLNQKKEAVLQRMKDNDVLGRWRWEAKMLQMKGPTEPYLGVSMPFGTDEDIPSNNLSEKAVTTENFRATMSDCLNKLKDFAANPAPITDTEKSMQRLKEVEDVQRKLLEMRLNMSVKTSHF